MERLPVLAAVGVARGGGDDKPAVIPGPSEARSPESITTV